MKRKLKGKRSGETKRKAIACLTIYYIYKVIDKKMGIGDIKLIKKVE